MSTISRNLVALVAPALILGCSGIAGDAALGLEAAPLNFNGTSYFRLSGQALEQTLAGKQLHYEISDGLGHHRIPFHGPENFGLDGEYFFKAHRGWIERGVYRVKGANFCVKVPRDHELCRQLFRSVDDRYLLVGEKPWPIRLLGPDEAEIVEADPGTEVTLCPNTVPCSASKRTGD